MLLFEFWAGNSPAFVVFALLLGLMLGSFINVVAHRLPLMLERDWKAQSRDVLGLPPEEPGPRFDLLLPASRCPHCGHAIRAWENIPLLSYALLRGKCSACKARISPRYPLVELACGLLSAWVAWHFGVGWQVVAALAFTWALLAATLIDIDHQLLPDAIVLPLLWLGLMVNAFGLFVPLADALWGAVAGYSILWMVFWAFKLLTGKDGMGYGDFKLLATFGAWGGWHILPLTLLLSSLVGAVAGLIILRVRNVSTSTAIPFGPYLAVAGWIALLWGDEITTSYLHFAGF